MSLTIQNIASAVGRGLYYAYANKRKNCVSPLPETVIDHIAQRLELAETGKQKFRRHAELGYRAMVKIHQSLPKEGKS